MRGKYNHGIHFCFAHVWLMDSNTSEIAQTLSRTKGRPSTEPDLFCVPNEQKKTQQKQPFQT